MILASTFGSFASVQFSDVPSDHWAKGFIAKMADKKIVSGYFDDKTLKVTFKPEKPVTYVESIQFIYSTLKGTNKLKSTTGLIAKHKSTLNDNNIPSWAHEAMAYALEYDMVHKDELKGFIKNDAQVQGKRVDVAVFLGKALDMKDAMDPLPVLSFKDAEMVKRVAVPYVDLLVKKKIISGDTENKFNPNAVITRAQMATMCAKTYDLLIQEPSDTTTVPKDQEGTIEYVSPTAKLIIVKHTNGDKKTYNLKTTYIKRDGQSITLNDLNKGDSIKLIFSSNGDVEKIEVKKGTTPNETTDSKDDIRIIDYVAEDTDMIIVKDMKGNTAVYNLKGVRIKINGKSKDIDDLNKGDGVKLIFDKNEELDEIQVDDTVTSMEGKVVSVKEMDEEDIYILTVRDKDNLIIKKELRIDDDTEIEYDNDDVDADQLMEGMDVYIKYVGDRAIEIEIDEEDKTYNGILESQVLFRDGLILKMRMNDGDVKEFEIDEDDIDVERDGDNAYLDELEKGDIVTITLEYGKITEIEAVGRTDKKSRVEGVIKQITIGDPSTVTIETDDDKEKVTYNISKSVDVRIDGKSSDDGDDFELKDLDIHYEVELRIDNGKVYRIDADKTSNNDSITGEITRVYDDYNQLKVKYFDAIEKEYRTVYVRETDDTTIISKEGKEISLRHLDEDDEVYVDGHYEDDMFIANRILQLK